MRKYVEATKKAAREAKWWAYAAWTLPFTALALIIFGHYVDSDNAYATIILLITTVFFSISVFWWWWALNKFVVLLKSFKRAEEHFEEIKDELKKTRETIRDVGNR